MSEIQSSSVKAYPHYARLEFPAGVPLVRAIRTAERLGCLVHVASQNPALCAPVGSESTVSMRVFMTHAVATKVCLERYRRNSRFVADFGDAT